MQAENIELVLYSLDRMFKSLIQVFDFRYEYGLSAKAVEYGYSILVCCCKDHLVKISKITGKDAKILISEFRAEVIGGITGSFSEMDKQRIEAESKYQAKQKIFFGAIILLGAVLIITMFGKKE